MSTDLTLTPEIVWAATGRFYGYPACCIYSFIERATEMRATQSLVALSPAQQAVCTNGFIPCRACADRLFAGGYPPSSLITRRKSAYPFPMKDPRESKNIAATINQLYAEYQIELQALHPDLAAETKP